MDRLARRQALELSPARFDFDTGRLLKVLDETLAKIRVAQAEPGAFPGVPQATGQPPEAPQRRRRSIRTWLLATTGIAVVLILLVVAVRTDL